MKTADHEEEQPVKTPEESRDVLKGILSFEQIRRWSPDHRRSSRWSLAICWETFRRGFASSRWTHCRIRIVTQITTLLQIMNNPYKLSTYRSNKRQFVVRLKRHIISFELSHQVNSNFETC